MARGLIVLLAAGTLHACAAPADPQVVVEERQADMRELDAAMSAIQAPGADLTAIKVHAARVRAIADRLDGQFRIPDREATSGTSPDAWARPGAFAGEAASFRRAAASLQAAARAGNRVAVADAATELESRCASCHSAFRAPKPDR